MTTSNGHARREIPLKKAAAFLILIFSVSFFLFAIDWPVREGTIAQNFGINDAGIPLLGDS
ncbi:MAG: hypothetical protein LBH07_07365, partial [Treponema sp.]|nr:hypothetical protein [Treponema sp.]